MNLMHNLNVRLGLVAGLLVLMSLVSTHLLYPERMDRGQTRAEQLPLELGDWFGVEEPVDDYVKRILETDDVVQRSYSRLGGSASPPVLFAVVYSPDNRRVAHPPEVCYRGAGWEVTDKRRVEYAGLPPMIRLLLDSGSRRDLVTYCYKSGDQITANYYRQQANIIFNQLLGRSTASALIRFSTSASDSEQAAERRLQAFARLMMPEVRRILTD